MKRFPIGAASALAIALSVAACGTSAPRTASQQAYVLESALNGAVKIENGYASRPRCSSTQAQPCSNQAVIDQMNDRTKQARVATDTAVATARDTSKSPTDIDKANVAAADALTGLQSLIAASVN